MVISTVEVYGVRVDFSRANIQAVLAHSEGADIAIQVFFILYNLFIYNMYNLIKYKITDIVP